MNPLLTSIAVKADVSGVQWSGAYGQDECRLTLSPSDWSGQLHGSIAKLRQFIAAMYSNGAFSGVASVDEMTLTYRYRRGAYVHAVTIRR